MSLWLNRYAVSRCPARNKGKPNRKPEPRRSEWRKFFEPDFERDGIAAPKHR